MMRGEPTEIGGIADENVMAAGQGVFEAGRRNSGDARQDEIGAASPQDRRGGRARPSTHD